MKLYIQVIRLSRQDKTRLMSTDPRSGWLLPGQGLASRSATLVGRDLPRAARSLLTSQHHHAPWAETAGSGLRPVLCPFRFAPRSTCRFAPRSRFAPEQCVSFCRFAPRSRLQRQRGRDSVRIISLRSSEMLLTTRAPAHSLAALGSWSFVSGGGSASCCLDSSFF